MSAILDEQPAVSILESYLPEVSVKHAHIAVYEKEAGDPVTKSRIFSSHLEPVNLCFTTRAFPPPGLYPTDELLNIVIIPLVFQEEHLGYIAFDANNLGPCVMIARQIAATFKASHLHAQVIELSLMDALTGVYNRRYFDMFLRNELDRSRRFGRDFAILMLDIDFFQAIQ